MTEIHLLFINFDYEGSSLIGAFDDKDRADRECAKLKEKNDCPMTLYYVKSVPLISGCDAFNPGRHG